MEPRRRRRGNLHKDVREIRALLLLQWSHGVAAVETAQARSQVPGQKEPSMEPRRRRRGNDVAGGVSAVVVQPSMEPRRRRRGNRARWWRARRTPRAFNGATASPPWKRSGWRLPRAALVPFNGATASPPWKHGVPLMELVQRSLPFNGATASPPWKPRTRDRTRCTLTPSMEPRRRRRGNLPCNSPVRCATCCLQWSHGVAAVETLRGELAHEPLELPSMEPRRRRRGNPSGRTGSRTP